MSRATIGHAMEILLVEDNLEDARVTIEALKHEGMPCRVSLVRDGEEAMRFLRHEGVFAKTPSPDLILLDIELPKKNGHQVLIEIRSDEALKNIPVLVMTASTVHQALLEAQNLRVDAFMNKPIGFDQFIAAVKSLRRSRLTELVLPSG